MIYIALYIMLFLASIYDIRKPAYAVSRTNLKNYKINIANILFFGLIITLILVAGTRYEVGIDYLSYSKEFQRAESMLKIESWWNSFSDVLFRQEITLYIIFWVCKSFNFALFVYALISLIPKSYVLQNNVCYPILGIFIYFLDFYMSADMGIIRQCAAMSFVLLSLKYIKDKNIIKYIICISIAFLFHRTAIIFAPAYLANKIQIKPIKAAIISTASLIFVPIDFSKIVNSILSFIPDGILGKYATRTFETETVSFGITTFYRLFLFWIFSFIFEKYKDNYTEEDKRTLNCAYNIIFFGTCGFYIFRSIYSISGRAMFYFFVFEMILIPILVGGISNAKRRVQFAFLIILLYSILFFSSLSNYADFTYDGYSEPYFPYKSFIFEN